MNRISIVGAGPGAIDLLSVRALDRLKEAEVLVWADSLVPKQIADLVPADCERISTSSMTLVEILSLLIDRFHKGKKVVRLPDGDPCLYGALSEQISALAEEGMDVEVGMSFRATTPQGEQSVIIIETTDEEVVVDGNHPLAGIPLTFDVTVVDVREATKEELEHGHVHGEGGCGHDH